jgi:hypothetical protein
MKTITKIIAGLSVAILAGCSDSDSGTSPDFSGESAKDTVYVFVVDTADRIPQATPDTSRDTPDNPKDTSRVDPVKPRDNPKDTSGVDQVKTRDNPKDTSGAKTVEYCEYAVHTACTSTWKNDYRISKISLEYVNPGSSMGTIGDFIARMETPVDTVEYMAAIQPLDTADYVPLTTGDRAGFHTMADSARVAEMVGQAYDYAENDPEMVDSLAAMKEDDIAAMKASDVKEILRMVKAKLPTFSCTRTVQNQRCTDVPLEK